MRPFKWGKSVLVLVAILTAASTFAAAVDTSSGSGTSEPSSPDPVVDPVIDSGSDPLADPVKGGDPSLSGDPNVSIDPSVKAISNTTGGTIKDPGVDQGSASIFGGIFDGWLVTYGSRLTFEDGTIVENTGRSSPNIINTGSICMDQNPSSNLIFQFGCHADDQYGTYSPGGHTAGTDDTNFTSAHYGYDTYASHGFPDSAHHSTAWRNCKKAILRTWTCGPGCTGGFTGGSDIQDTACYYYVQAPNPPKVFDISAGDLSDAAIKDSGIGPFALSGPPETPTMNPTASAFWVMLDWPSLKLQLQGLIPYPAVYPHDNPATVGFEYGIGTASFGITGSTIITSHPFTPIGYGLSWIYETIGGSTSYPVSCGVNYAVRAYAQNSSGTSYSNWVDLTVPCPAPIVIMDPTTPRIQLSLTGSSGSLTNLNMFKGKLISAGITSSSGASSTVVGLGFEYCDTSASGCSASSMPSSASVIYSGAFPGSAFTGGYTSFSTGSFDSIGWGYYTGSGTAGATALTCGHSYYVRAKASNGTTAYSVAYSPIVSVSVACPSAPHITTNSYSGSAIVASPSASSVTVTAAMDFASGGAAPTPAPVSNVTLEYGNATTSSSTSTWISGTVGSVSIPATAIVVPASCSTSASSYTLSSSYPIPPTAVPCIQASASLPIPACSGVAQTVYYQFKSTDNLTQTTLGGIQSVSVPACVSPVLSLSSAGATYSFSSSALTATFQTGTLTSLGSFPFSGLTFRFSYEDAGSATTGTTSAPGGTAGAAVASVTGSGAGATFAASSTWAGLCGKRFYYWPSVSYGSSTWFGYDSSGRSGLILMPPCITTTAYSGGTVAGATATASVSANLSMTAASALPVNLFVRSATSTSALGSAAWVSASSSAISSSGSYSASISLPACAATPQTIYYEFKASNVSGGATASGGVQSLARAACPAPSIAYPATWTITAGAGGSLSPTSSSYVSAYSITSCSLSGISINASTGVLSAASSITAATSTPVNCTISASGTSSGSASATVTIAVIPASAHHLRFTSAPASAVSGTPVSFIVQVVDAYNNPTGVCPSSALSMSATGASFTGTGSCSGGAWSVSGTFTTAGSILVTATSSGVASATTTVSVSGGTLHHLGFVGTPPASITSGAPTTFQIQRYDSAGNPLGCVGSGSLTLTPAVFGTGATCSGTGTSSVFSATGTFGAAGAVTITATQGAHSVTHSATVVAGAAHHLGFVSPPASTTAGSTVSFVLKVFDAAGNVAGCPAGALTLTPASNFAGTLACSAGQYNNGGSGLNGVFTVASAAPITISASVSGVTGTSTTLAVNTGSASALVFMAAPPSSVSIGSPITGLQIKAVDSFGNTVSSFGGAATISSSDGFASLPSAGSVTFSSGISTAFNVTLNSIGSFTITGASGSLSVTSSPISASGTAPTFTCDDSWGAVPLNPTVNATPTTTNLWLNPSTLVSDASYHYGWKPVCDYSTSGAYVSSVECPVLTAVSGGGTYGTYSSSTACMQNGDSAASFVKRIDQHSTTPLANVIALGTGPVNTCAIGGASSSATSGQVYCTGDNSVGQLGTGVIGLGATHLIPVPGLSSVRQISVGPATVCAVVDDSTTVTAVKCWGDNSYQQLGSGSVAMSATPVTVSIPLASGSSSEYITQVSVDGFPLGATACAVSNLNNVYCWGSNNYHQFGNGSLSSSPLSPQRAFKNASGAYYAVSKIVTNGIATCGLLTSGTAVCSGKNPSSTASGAYNYSHYMLSNSSINTIALDFAGAANPVNVEALASSGTALSNLTDISLGHNNGCVRQSSSAGDLAYCWGNGYSSTGPVAQVAAQPVQTAASTTLTGVSRVMVGYDQICAFISGSSTPYCLGQNRHNVFAIGSGTGTTYVQYATALSAYAGATQLAVTSYDAPHLCMIASSGGVSNGATCNGPNWNGQLGNERIGSYGGASPIYYTPDWMKK